MLPRDFWKWTFPAFILVAVLAAFFNPPGPGVTAPNIEYVQRVVDGDTLVLGTGERVRLIGVDAPESRRPEHSHSVFRKGKRLHLPGAWPKERV
jgi:endonuclease YncB( thermonuclease family)